MTIARIALKLHRVRTEDLNFDLPPDLIAQHPPLRRGESRLLHYRRADGSITHRTFGDLPTILQPSDLLVLNNARVLPARFMLIKPTGGQVEGLFLRRRDDGEWIALLKNLGPIRPGMILRFDGDESIAVQPVGREAEAFLLRVESDEAAEQILARVGRMPLPPYIRRQKGHDTNDSADAERYQTVYAAASGSVAAPTAGLHFTPELFEALDRRKIERAFVTLHVGAGTFKPVTAETLAGHAMHSERYEIDAATADQLNAAKRGRRRIVAVGTTSARVLESHPADAEFRPGQFDTSILIYPPYPWRHVGALLTNFHLPKSTLVALVAAMVGLEEQKRIYRHAIEQRYRFFSFGDAMFIE